MVGVKLVESFDSQREEKVSRHNFMILNGKNERKKISFSVEMPNLSTETIDYEPIDDNYITDMNAPAVYSDYNSDSISSSNVAIPSLYFIGFVLTLQAFCVQSIKF